MKQLSLFAIFSFLVFSCSHTNQESSSVNQAIQESIDSLELLIEEEREGEHPDSLFAITFIGHEKQIELKPPKYSSFSFPDGEENIAVEHFKDFNGDGETDVMVYLGACGTGGCVYAVFINQYDDYYKLAFNDYLKGPAFEKDENGALLINSYEEVEAYDPSKLHVTTFKFDSEYYQYLMDTIYIFYDTLE